MAVLEDALAATHDLSEAGRPPNLGPSGSGQRCGTCRWWKARGLMTGAGACRLYGGWPTHESDVCDSYQPRSNHGDFR